MKKRMAFVFTTAFILSACTGSPKTSSEVAVQERAAESSAVQLYQCDSGATVSVVYSSADSAIVQYKEQDYSMSIDVSASGSRYASGELEWWTKTTAAGIEGTLLHHQQDGSSGDIIERCRET